jgi:cobalt-zinc-cadmium efflux system membrane fusion protein
MTPRWRSALVAARDHVPTLLVLALLGGVGWWGATHEWTLPSLAKLDPDDEPRKEETKKDSDEDKNSPRLVDLHTEEAVEKAGLTFDEARVGRVREYVTANGEVGYDQDHLAHLSSRVAGTVWSVEKGPGSEVEQGDVLAVVSSAEVGRAKTEFFQSLLQYQVRGKNLQYARSAAGSIPDRQLREAEAQLREASIKLLADQQTLLNLGLAIRVEDVEGLPDREVADRLRVLGLQGWPPGAAAQSSNLIPIRTPLRGTVVQRDLVVGESVGTTATYFTVANLERVWVLLHVRPEDAARVKPKAEVSFFPDATGQEKSTGTVAWVSDTADEKTRTVPVRVVIGNKPRRLRPHTFGTGRVVVGEHAAVQVPDGAVQEDVSTRSYLVFVRKGPALFEARAVVPGLSEGGRTEVCTGLAAGEQVVVVGSRALKSELFKERIGTED